MMVCLICVVGWLAVAVSAAAAADLPRPVFPTPPRYATTPAELAALEAAGQLAARREQAIRAAEPLVEKPVPLPEGFGGWIFHYACPDDGTTLRPVTPEEHECPACRKRLTDPRTIAAYRCQLHYDAEQAAAALGWAHALTGDDRYAAGVRRILLALAADYAGYPDRQDRWGRWGFFAPLGGRRYVQSLDEAVGTVRLATGYDLTRTSAVWSDDDRRRVEEDLFRATSRTLLRFNQGTSNHQTWYNAGLVAIASTLADERLLAEVVSMRGGFLDQLERSVGPEGLWWEGTVAYHNYALQAMIAIADGGRRVGLPLHESPRFRSLFEGPLRLTYPDGSFPAINDSDPAHLRSFAAAYAWAAERYRDPRFARAAAAGRPRGAEEPTDEFAPAVACDLLPGAGVAVLRQGAGREAACLFVDFGPHGGGHGHPDKLGITLFAAGREWLLDPGRLSYSHREHLTWSKTTAAHNTVVLGGESQAPHTGRFLWRAEGPGWVACAAETDGAYRGATLRRSILLTPEMAVDVVDVAAAAETQVDLLAHARSDSVEPVAAVALEPAAVGDGDGYAHFTDVRGADLAETAAFDFVAGPSRLRAWLVAGEPEQVLLARGIGYTVPERTPTIIRRRQAATTRFVTIYDLGGAGTCVRGVSADRAGPGRVVVETTSGRWQIVFSDAGVDVRR
jgi:hypothetical protein